MELPLLALSGDDGLGTALTRSDAPVPRLSNRMMRIRSASSSKAALRAYRVSELRVWNR